MLEVEGVGIIHSGDRRNTAKFEPCLKGERTGLLVKMGIQNEALPLGALQESTWKNERTHTIQEYLESLAKEWNDHDNAYLSKAMRDENWNHFWNGELDQVYVPWRGEWGSGKEDFKLGSNNCQHFTQWAARRMGVWLPVAEIAPAVGSMTLDPVVAAGSLVYDGGRKVSLEMGKAIKGTSQKGRIEDVGGKGSSS